MKVLVMGVDEEGKNLGYHVRRKAQAASYMGASNVYATGVNATKNGYHNYPGIAYLNVMEPDVLRRDVNWEEFDAVVYCIGQNKPVAVNFDSERYVGTFDALMRINCTAAVEAAHLFINSKRHVLSGVPSKFVVVSSNSAHVPRSESAAYCASKAALSMAIRCMARDVAKLHIPVELYGYEPCWMEGTPMSNEVAERLGSGVMPHRVPGGAGMNPEALANVIVGNLQTTGVFHGTMLATDLGDI